MPLPSGAPASGDPVVDMRRLWDCADGDREELQRLIRNYLQEMEAQLEKMEHLMTGGAFPEMAHCAHRSCGASATLGMRAIAAPLRALERMNQERAAQDAATQLAEARRELCVLGEFLKDHPALAGWRPKNSHPHS